MTDQLTGYETLSTAKIHGPVAIENFSVIVPTYNEKQNLEPLVERIEEAVQSLKCDYEILVVDDDSPDETWRKAEELADEYPVRVLRRKEGRDLTGAVLDGFEEARYDVFVVMDADLQHPPEKIPELMRSISDGNDLVAGSRYEAEGGFGEFGPLRKTLSKLGDGMARTLFRRARRIRDVLSGFFAVRRSVVADADLNPIGFKILLEILMHGDYDQVDEVGYVFDDRRHGESKLGLENLFNYFLHLIRLSWREGPFFLFVKFCLVGGIGSIVNLVITYLLTSGGTHYLVSGITGIEMGLISNFLLNWAWTYGDRSVGGWRGFITALGRDHLVRSIGLSINVMCLWGLTEIIGMYYLLSQVTGIGVGTIFNFVGNQWWTWEVNGEPGGI